MDAATGQLCVFQQVCLANPEARALVQRLLATARDLVDRAVAADEGIVRRSSFAHALRRSRRLVGTTVAGGGASAEAGLTEFETRHPRVGTSTLQSPGYEPRWRVAPMRGVLVSFGPAGLFAMRPLFDRDQLEPYSGDRHRSPGFHLGGGYFAEPGRSATLSIGATGPVRRFTPKRRAEIGRILCDLAGKVAIALQIHGHAVRA